MKIKKLKFTFGAILAIAIAAMTGGAFAETFIVEDGKSNAEIVIAENAKRMAALGALELQFYLEKMTGARLPIVTEPDDNFPVKIYVGESDFTKKLGVTAEGLEYEAFRMVSGDDWLALVGEDADFEPPKPFAGSPSEIPRAEAEWEEMLAEQGGGKWGYPFRLNYKEWWNPRQRKQAETSESPTQFGTEWQGYDEIMTTRYGADTKHVWNPRSLEFSTSYQGPGAGAGFWYQDRGGSLNAVYEFLRSLGVRWYMPLEVGEVVPTLKSVALPKIDETVEPDFPVRTWVLYNYNGEFFPGNLWVKRLGMNHGDASLGYARTAHLYGHPVVYDGYKDSNPEYFALIGGERDLHSHRKMACYSSEELAQETVRFAKFMYDHYDQPAVSIWPADGFIKCECELCSAKSETDVVWGFVDRVARELNETHPDRMVLCGAYTSYAIPPPSIEKFTPNVMVFIANRGRPSFDHPDQWKRYWDQIEGWKSKTAPGRIVRGDNNRYSLKGNNFPVIHPRTMAKDLHALKGISIGEVGEVSQRKARWHSPGLEHLTLYVQSRLAWDADRDVEEILDEYYKLFYGPAEKEAREALEFAQANYNRLIDPLVVPIETRVEFLEKLYAAREKAGDTIYGERLQVMIDELPSLEDSRQELEERIAAGDPRENNPVVTISDTEKSEALQLVDLKTGEDPDVETTFTLSWDEDAFVLEVTCQEPDMDNLSVTQTVWNGDSVAILLEAPNHSYYQLEINPDGEIFDADRLYGKINQRWTAKAEVLETERGDDFWRVKVRIPVVAPENNMGDPFHYIVGSKPSEENPWFFNVGRSRVRGGEQTSYLFNTNPEKNKGYHGLDQFAKLVVAEPEKKESE